MRHPHAGRGRRAAAIVGSTLGLVLGLLPAQAAAQPFAEVAVPAPAAEVAAAATRVGAAGNEYATDVFNDPWDYSNTDDIILNFSGTQKLADLRMADGMVRGTVTAAGAYISPVWGGYNDAILAGRDASLNWNKVDAAKYDTIALRLHSDQDVANGFYLNWFRCSTPAAASSCGGNSSTFHLRAGWNTYVIALGKRTSGQIDWSGKMNGLRLVFAKAGASVALDWARIYDRGTGTKLALSGFDPARGFAWDANSSDSDNTATGRNWGIVRTADKDPSISTTVSGSTVDLSFLPAGTYRIGAVPASGTISWTTITLDSSRPRLITPDEKGDKDYATTVLKNSWDFNSAADIDGYRNATVSFAGGKLHGRNAGPNFKDPQVMFTLGSGGIDGRVYRHLTITTSYSGVSNLGSGPGGGTMARIMWRKSNKNTAAGQTSSRDVVTYPGTRTITLDMGMASKDLIGAGPASFPFVSADKVTQLRWDPNEDPATGNAARQWTIEDLQLRSDFTADGSFPITWVDEAYQSGGISRLTYSKTRGDCSGTEIGKNMPVNKGTNTTIWNTRNLAAGRYYICLEIQRNGSTVKRPSTGPIVVSHVAGRPAPPNPPSLIPLATKGANQATIAWSSGTGNFTGYQVQDVVSGTLKVFNNKTKKATFACPNGKGKAQFQVRTYGPGGVSGWSKRSNTVSC